MDNLIPILIHKTLGFIELFKKMAHMSVVFVRVSGEFELPGSTVFQRFTNGMLPIDIKLLILTLISMYPAPQTKPNSS